MRTNIELDETALKELMQLTGAATKKKAVNDAIRQQLQWEKSARSIHALRGKVEWEGDLDAMRRAE